MGHKFSTVHGVKSNNFYESGNAINEIWLGNLEIISRLPFGDSDIRQAGWPQGTWPKIPWHQFIIPLKRDIHPVACDGPACHPAPSMQTSLALRRRVVSFYVASLLVLLMILIRLLVKLSLRWNRVVPIHLKDPENSISQVHNPVISEHCSRPLLHVNPGENKNASNDMTAVDSSRALNL